MLRSSASIIINQIQPYLQSACTRLEPAGSWRRGKRDLGDIELLALEKPGRPRLEFGKPESAFQSHIDRVILQIKEDGYIAAIIRDGPRWKTIRLRPEMFPRLKESPLPTIDMDLFIVAPPAQWGVQMVIRTGPGGKGGFSQWMVTQRSKGGVLPNGYVVREGAVWEADEQGERADPAGEPIPMPEETDFFEFCGLPFIPPNERIPNWRRHR